MKILIVGEAYGEQEALVKRAFVGAAGQELRKMLREAGYDPGKVDYTNVFNFRPEKNDITTLCVDKRTAVMALMDLKSQASDKPWPATYTFPAIAGPGKYLHPKYLPHVWEVQRKLSEGWDLVVPLGNVASWAVIGNVGISKIRGYWAKSPFCGAKILPTFHPAAVLRNWSLRPVVVADLIKARSEQKKDSRTLIIEPTIEEIKAWRKEAETAEEIAVDIETKPVKRQILCVGFGTAHSAISIPLADRRNPTKNYWKTLNEELEALAEIKALLTLPVPKVWQNGLYDIQWLWRFLGLWPSGAMHDTMLLHHALQPEMDKGLGFLGSIYTDGAEWKTMRKKAKLTSNSEKRDD